MQHPFLLYVPQSPGDVKECQERLEKDMRTLGTVACVKVGMRRGGGIGHSAFVTDAMQQYGEVYEDIFRYVSEVCDGQEPCTIEGFKVSQHEAYKLERSSRKCSNGCCCAFQPNQLKGVYISWVHILILMVSQMCVCTHAIHSN